MSMFSQKDELPQVSSVREMETIIGPSVKVDGNFRGQGNVIVEGTVGGSIKTEKDVTIGKGAKVAASITAANAKISGEVRGSLKIKGKLELTETAKVLGDIETEILSVAPGAILNGKCTMLKESAVAEVFSAHTPEKTGKERLEKKKSAKT